MAAALTVVIPVWDEYCRLLPEAVASALGQRPAPAVIVVDNASAVPLPALDSAVTVIRSVDRLSAGEARNLGLAHVNTPLVLFLDADDRLLDGALTHLCGVLEDTRGAVAAVGRHLRWSPASGAEALAARSPRPAVRRIARHRRAFALLTLRFDCFPLVGCAVIRTDVARDCAGFGDANLAEDWILRSALAFRGRIGFTAAPVVRVRVSSGSLWQRPHDRAELDAMYRSFRTARLADPRLPGWARILIPAVALAHRRDARRLTRSGAFTPAGHGLAAAGPAAEPEELSVVVCTHERPEDLDDCLRALAACNPCLEVVVVDSGPSVPCRELVIRHRDRLPGVRYVHVPEPGLSRARNAGVAAATGELVAFIDDDAAVQPGWDRAIVAAFAGDSDIGCVGGACRPRFAAERPPWLSDRLLSLSSITRFGDGSREPRSSAEWPFGANMAFRRRALAEIGPFAEELGRRGSLLLSGEDSDMVARALRAGWRVWLEPAAVVLHTVHAERLQSRFYWRRLWWAGVGRAQQAAARTTLRLLVAVPVRMLLWALTGDRIYMYRLAESAGYMAGCAKLGAGASGA